MLQCVCVPFAKNGVSTYFEKKPLFEIDHTRLIFGIFQRENELNPAPYPLTSEYVHDYQYYYNEADFFENEELQSTCSIYFYETLSQIAVSNQFRIFYATFVFDPEFIQNYVRDKALFRSDSFIEIDPVDFAEVMPKIFDLFFSGYGFMCRDQDAKCLLYRIENDSIGRIMETIEPEMKLIAFEHVRDYLAYKMTIQNMTLKEIILSGNLREVNDHLAGEDK